MNKKASKRGHKLIMLVDGGFPSTIISVENLRQTKQQYTPMVQSGLEYRQSKKHYKLGSDCKTHSLDKARFPTHTADRNRNSHQIRVWVEILNQPRLLCLFDNKSLTRVKGTLCFGDHISTTNWGKKKWYVLINQGRLDQCHLQLYPMTQSKENYLIRELKHRAVTHSALEKKPQVNAVEHSRRSRPSIAVPKAISHKCILDNDLKENRSKFRTACFINNKKGDTTAEHLAIEWFEHHSSSKYIMRDQRAELFNDVVRDLCQSQSIKHTTTASYWPHQNALGEKGHVVADRILERMMIITDIVPTYVVNIARTVLRHKKPRNHEHLHTVDRSAINEETTGDQKQSLQPKIETISQEDARPITLDNEDSPSFHHRPISPITVECRTALSAGNSDSQQDPANSTMFADLGFPMQYNLCSREISKKNLLKHCQTNFRQHTKAANLKPNATYQNHGKSKSRVVVVTEKGEYLTLEKLTAMGGRTININIKETKDLGSVRDMTEIRNQQCQ